MSALAEAEKWAGSTLAAGSPERALLVELDRLRGIIMMLRSAGEELLRDVERVGVQDGLADQIDPDVYRTFVAVMQAASTPPPA